MILAVSGSTANVADPLDGNGVTPVYAGPQMHKYTNTQMHKYTNTQIHKYTNTQIHKYTNTQIHKYKYTNAQIHNFKHKLNAATPNYSNKARDALNTGFIATQERLEEGKH